MRELTLGFGVPIIIVLVIALIVQAGIRLRSMLMSLYMTEPLVTNH